ncbi:glycosyltransferase [Oceanicoccus sagamiensis]|uniref:Glycosyl transferase n=1 Tax=Oceanicoccus sagamiensis TaxID=716816 RepID=A0A1X9N9K3_9GAMM|nr:glycosyltransferase [Oceanicoccus sagamiensis]ARN73861.1 hypothetical protein BST96_06875 [Oceanicoccus sagamiensis]
MTERAISATTVTYFSELELLRILLVSMEVAAAQLHQKTGYAVHYYIVDNSDDEVYFKDLELLCSAFGETGSFELTLIKAPANLGYSGGNNLMIDQLASDYHLIINPDVAMEPDALWRALEYLQQHSNVVMLSPKVVHHRKSCHVIKVYPDCFTLALRYVGRPSLNRFFAKRLARYECPHLQDAADTSIELAGGCFLFLPTDLLKQLGGFDESFFLYFEDYDLSIRARQLGKLAYVPSVKISHAGGDVGRKTLQHHLFFIVSAVKFFQRYGWRLW